VNNAIRITAVIPAYNAESFLRRSLDSALSQTLRPAEIIVVDDGSTDRTAEIVKSYGEAVNYIYQENGGGAAALNAGIAAGEGPWVAILDADDEWRPRHLENAVRVLGSHHELSWYGAPVNRYDHKDGSVLFEYTRKGRGTLVDKTYFADYLSACPPEGFFAQPTMVLHKRVFEAVGLFDTTKRTGYDLNMWFRIGLQFPKIGYCYEAGTNVYKREDSVSRTTIMDFRKTLAFWKELEDLAIELGQEERTRAEPKIMYRILLLLRGCINSGDLQGIRAVSDTYDKRLPPKWRLLARFYVTVPWAIKGGRLARGAFRKACRFLRGRIAAKERSAACR